MDDLSGRNERLWADATAGDSSAFAQLFDTHRDRVFRHAYWLLRDIHEAEDAAATAFLELWRRRKQVRLVDGSVLPWLLVTTTYVCRNVQRATSRYRALIDALPREAAESDAATEFLETHPLESVDTELLVALRRLSVADMQLFIMIALEDYTVSAAGAAIGITPSAAKARLHRVRKRLKNELADGDYGISSAELRMEGADR